MESEGLGEFDFRTQCRQTSRTPGERCAASPVRAILFLLSLALPSGVAAQQVGNDAPPQGEVKPTSFLFGFTSNSQTGRAGQWNASSELTGRFVKRQGEYAGLVDKIGVGYSVTDRFTVSPSLQFQYMRVEDVPNIRDRDALQFAGTAVNLKYRIADRSKERIGAALESTLIWTPVSFLSGQREDTFIPEVKAIVDAELVPEKLFAAANVKYQPVFTRSRDQGWTESSAFEASAAISTVIERASLGLEVRYATVHEDLFLGHRQGHALFVGPTASVALSERVQLGAAWSFQVAGEAAGEPLRDLDLVNFERHQLRINLGFSF